MRLVQDLWIINEAVAPFHPVVPNPYTLLSEIPERVKYFSVIYLKFAFWVKPILNHPLPMTLRQLRGFFGIIGYCCIWIPSYGELAWPLYKLITETQQAQTDKLLWSPYTQRLLRLFRLLSCKLLLWACPPGQNSICLSLKEKVWSSEFWHNPEGLTSYI